MKLSKYIKMLLLGLISSIFIYAETKPESAKAADQNEQPHVVIVSGPPHYSPEVSMPLMADELRKHGFKVTIVQGDGNSEKKTENVLPNIEVLAEADLAIFFMRFLKLGDEEWQPIEDYLKSGKPVMGFRTAGHAFNYPKTHKRYNWNHDFGDKVFGTPYVVHMGGKTDITVDADNKNHPILSHITETNWISAGTLYLTRFSDKTKSEIKPLLSGFGKIGKPKTVTRSFGEVTLKLEETADVAWTWENEWGGKVFFTSLGHPGDFTIASFNRMWLNAVCWATGKPIPAADTEIPVWNIKRLDKKH